MALMKTERFAIRDSRDNADSIVSGSIRVEWTEAGQDKSTFFDYNCIPSRDDAIFDAMQFVVTNRNLLD